MVNLAAAAGVINILKTKIIPTDCIDEIIHKDKTTRKILSNSLTFNPEILAPFGSNEINKSCDQINCRQNQSSPNIKT